MSEGEGIRTIGDNASELVVSKGDGDKGGEVIQS